MPAGPIIFGIILGMSEVEKGDKVIKFRKSLRNANINYRNGWFFVTSQVAHNKSILGAIVGEECVLNSLGKKVREYWLSLPAKYPELTLDEFVVMPNHFHAIVKIEYRSTNREHHLGFLMSRFKGGTGYIYGKMRREGLVADIGEHLWQFDYWDDLITSESELEGIRKYIRDNPANWSRDRFGACTSYSFGNLALLNERSVAFVASQGFAASALRPQMVRGGLRGDLRAKARRTDIGEGANHGARRTDIGEGANHGARRTDIGEGANHGARRTDIGEGANHGARRIDTARRTDIVADDFSHPIISTFTSAQEREALRRALIKGRYVIQVAPHGIPPESDMLSGLSLACREGRALIISPQPPLSKLNKKVATWCNEYVLHHADEIWVGDISPNGMLSSILSTMGLNSVTSKSDVAYS